MRRKKDEILKKQKLFFFILILFFQFFKLFNSNLNYLLKKNKFSFHFLI